MLTLLKLQLFRARKDKMIWIFFFLNIGITFISTLFFALINYLMKSLSEVASFSVSSSLLSTFVRSNTISLLFSIVQVVFLSKEFRYGTLRNQVVSGYSRFQIFVSYILFSLIIGGIFLLSSQILTLLVSLLFRFELGFDSVFSFFNNANRFLISYICLILLFVLFLVFITSLTMSLQSTPLSILLSIALPSIFALGYSILSVLSATFDPNVIEILRVVFAFIPYFNNLSLSNSLLLSSVMDGSLPGIFQANETSILICIISTFGYTFLSFFGGYLIFRKKDIK